MGNINWNEELMRAAAIGKPSALQEALDKGADVNSCSYGGGKTPLMSAAANRHYDCVEKLIEAKADVNAVNDTGGTALFVAVKSGDWRCIEQLFAAGANGDALVFQAKRLIASLVDDKDKRKYSKLFNAASSQWEQKKRHERQQRHSSLRSYVRSRK